MYKQAPHNIKYKCIIRWKGSGKVEKKYVNEFTARRNEKRPNQYSKEAQTKREKLAKMKQEEYAEKREQKIQEKATKVRTENIFSTLNIDFERIHKQTFR